MSCQVQPCYGSMIEEFRISRTRLEWKKRVRTVQIYTKYKHPANDQQISMYCGKLLLPLAVQIEKFVRILPMPLRQFVVSIAHFTFAEVTESVKTYQELIEIDTVSHVFNNVSFNNVGCRLCNESHKSLDCPSLDSIIEMEVSSSVSLNESSSCHVHARPTMIMVHEDAVIMVGLVLPLDHPDIMIGIMYPDRIIVVIVVMETSQMIGITYPDRITVVKGIIETRQMIGTTTIEIGITALTSTI